MRGRFGRIARLPLAMLAMALAALASASTAQAAVPNDSLTPFVSCYWDNNDGTVTVSVGVTSTNAGTVTVPAGVQNRITVGVENRGQPTSFQPGAHSNVWAATVSYTEIGNNINWSLTGNTVRIATFTECSAKPVPANGNPLASVLFGTVVTVAGAALLGERRRRRNGRGSGSLSEDTT